MDRIIFLGTAGDIFTVSRQFFSSGGIILQDNDTILHLDPGPGSLIGLKKHGIDPRKITSVVVSSDNTIRGNDVPALMSCMSYDGFDKRGVLIQNRESNFPKTDYLEKIIYLSPFDGVTEVEIGDVGIVALPCYGTGSIGFKFITRDSTVVYSGDTKFNEALIDKYKGADVLILNMPSVDESQGLDKESVISLISGVKPSLAIVTGFGIKMLQVDILNEIREINKATGVQTIAAKDDYVIRDFKKRRI